MNREIRTTGDGSHTFYVHELDEPYHSIHGSIQESSHVFIEMGLQHIEGNTFRILECGLGTGLNLLLTLIESYRQRRQIYYHAAEKYPLDPDEYRVLNFESILTDASPDSLLRIHEGPWNQPFKLADHFTVFKEQSDFRNMDPIGLFDLVYFDAFAPNKQPALWSEKVFSKIFSLMNPGAVMVTYTSKGTVRRTLTTCGFNVEKVPGPPGKREMIRATRR